MKTNKLATIGEVLREQGVTFAQAVQNPIVYRFELFRGEADATGKVVKTKTLGFAYLREGLKTYIIHLKTFLNEKYYLLPNARAKDGEAQFAILTREDAKNSTRKYHWNNVGSGRLLEDINQGYMKLSWDLLPVDVYMNLHATNVNDEKEVQSAEAA